MASTAIARFAMDPSEGWAVSEPAADITFDLNDLDGDDITGPPCGRFTLGAVPLISDETIVVWTDEFTWLQLGMEAGAGNLNISISGYQTKDVVDLLAAGTLVIDVVSGGNIVYASAGLRTHTLDPMVDSVWLDQGSGSGHKVITPYDANNTKVRLRLTYTLLTGSVSTISEIDTIDLQLSFDPGQAPSSTGATFNLITAETWAEVGDTVRISYAQDALNGQPLPCGKMTFDTSTAWGSGTTVFERARTKIYTWEDLGVPAGATVLTVTCDSYYWRLSVSTFLVSGNAYLDVVSAAGVIVHSVGDLDSFLWPSGPAVPWSQRLPGVSRAVDVAYRASNTQVKMQTKVAVDNSVGLGEPGDYYEFDTIALTITYVLPAGVHGWVYSSICGAQGLGSDT